MTPEFPQNEREQLEAKLTAFLLGELPPDEVVALCKAMDSDPELAALYERLKQTIDLVKESGADSSVQAREQAAPLKLPGEKREKLLAHFKTVAPEEFKKPRRPFGWLVPAAAAAALLFVLAGLLLPSLAKSKSRAMLHAHGVGGLAGRTWSSDRDESAMNVRLEVPKESSTPVSVVTGSVASSGQAGKPIATSPSRFPIIGPVSTPAAGAELASTQGGIFLPNSTSLDDAGKSVRLNFAMNGDVGVAQDQLMVTNSWHADQAEPTYAATSVQTKVPKLGDTPTLGRLYREETKLADVNGNRDRGDLGVSGTQVWIYGGSGGESRRGELPAATHFAPTAGVAVASPAPQSAAALQTQTFGVDSYELFKRTQSAAAASTTGSLIASASGANAPDDSPTRGLRYVTGLDTNAETQVAVKNYLAKEGVDISGAKSVFFNDRDGTLTVHATTEDLDRIEAGLVAMTNTVALNKDYFAASQNLDEEKRLRQMLAMRISQEEVDKNLPNVRMVKIMDLATTEAKESSSFGAKVRQVFTGKVERTARIVVEQEHPDVQGVDNGPILSGYDPYFLQTEFETIQSDAVLKKVVEQLNLDGGDPAKTAESIQRVKSDLDLRPVRNTKFIEIGALSKNPEEAAKLANAVAEAYRQYRNEEFDELKNHGLKSLQQQLQEQDKKVTQAQMRVDSLAKSLSLSNKEAVDTALPKPSVPPPTPQPEMLTRENAFSTFSLNVSDVSFKLAAASLEKGQMPDPASIRSEEFINAFDYRDPEAPAGMPIAFASERARYPFAHNRELLRFSLKTAAAGRQAGRPLNIVLLLDNSGSMERADRVGIIREALRVLAGQLQAQDVFSIVTFARTPQLRVDGIPGNQAASAAAEIAKLTPEGGTNLGDALDAAYQTALHHYLAKGDNRVVLLTDGAANLGDVDPEALKQKVEAHRKQGIALDCFGIGWEDYNDDLLEVLTRHGDGRYGFINAPEEANTTFVSQIAGALHVAASDVKVQVEFNPKRVISYRQIGYAKHQLTKEQFRDNTVDAAEIAAQEAGNALYTIEINPQGEGSIGTVRVRYKVPGTSDYREQAWDVPYTGSAVAMEQASPAMRLATTASAFSEWLATSPFAEEVSPEALLKYLSGVTQVYGADKRPAQLEEMIRQARSISGK